MGINGQRAPEKLAGNFLGAESLLKEFDDPEFTMRKNKA
jgi:hypothetical protein